MKHLSTFLFATLSLFSLTMVAQTTYTFSSGSWSPSTPDSSTLALNDSIKVMDGSTTIEDGWDCHFIAVFDGASATYSGSDSVSADFLWIVGTFEFSGSGSMNLAILVIDTAGNYLHTGSGDLNILLGSIVTVSNSNSSNQYNCWSSCLDGVTLVNVNNNNPCDIYHYDSKLQDWKYDYAMPYNTTCGGSNVSFTSAHAITDGTADGLMDIGLGYFIPGSSNTLILEGTAPKNGTITIDVNGTSLSRVGGNDWNLLGNPYPSGLDLDAFLTTNSSVVGTAVYVYDATTNNYLTFSNGDGEILSKCQGFMVDPSTLTDGVIGQAQFLNSHRSAASSTFRSNSMQQAFISLTNSNGLEDKMRIIMDMNCSNGIDNVRDAKKLDNWSGLNIASYIDTNKYVINGILPIAENNEFATNLFVQLPDAGNYVIALDSIQNIDNHDWLIKDLATNFTHNFEDGPFSISSNASADYTNRFQLIIKNNSAQGGGNQGGTTNVAQVNPKAPKITHLNTRLTINGNGKYLSSVKVFDTTGRLVISRNNLGNSTNISTSELYAGIYIVNVKANDNKYTVKIVVK